MPSLPVQIAVGENTFVFFFFFFLVSFIFYDKSSRDKSLMSSRDGGCPSPCVCSSRFCVKSPLPWFHLPLITTAWTYSVLQWIGVENSSTPTALERLGQDTGPEGAAMCHAAQEGSLHYLSIGCFVNSLGRGWVLVGLSCKPSLFSPLSLGINSLCSVPSPAVA